MKNCIIIAIFHIKARYRYVDILLCLANDARWPFTTEDELELVCNLSNAISNDLE